MNSNSSIETPSAGLEQAICGASAGVGGNATRRIAGAAYAAPNGGLFHVKHVTFL